MTVTLAPPTASRARSSDGRLRIAHVVGNFTAGSGGIALREALALDPDRYSNTIIAPEGGSLFPRAEEAGLDVIRLPHMGTGRRVYPWSDAETFRELTSHLRAGRFDLVHTHAARAGALGRVAAARIGVPAIIHTLHGFPFNEFQSAPTRAMLRAIERRLGRITDYFLTDGTFVASEAVRLKIARPDRIRALISPIDPIPVATEAARREARKLLGIANGVKVVGTTARLAVQKAPLDMVKAFARLDRQDVCMVWLGDGELRAKTERLIRREGLEGRFLLLGNRDDVPRLIPGFDVFVMPSLWEGLSCSVVEAITCGVPVVATAVNSVPEVIVPGRTGLLVKPNDPASLSQAVAYMLDHSRDAARMAEAARAYIGEQYRADVLGQELTDVYELAFHLSSRRAARVVGAPS